MEEEAVLGPLAILLNAGNWDGVCGLYLGPWWNLVPLWWSEPQLSNGSHSVANVVELVDLCFTVRQGSRPSSDGTGSFRLNLRDGGFAVSTGSTTKCVRFFVFYIALVGRLQVQVGAESCQSSGILTSMAAKLASFLTPDHHICVPTLSGSSTGSTVQEGILAISTKLASGRALKFGDRVRGALSVKQILGASDQARPVLASTEPACGPAVTSHYVTLTLTSPLLLGPDTISLLHPILARAKPARERTHCFPENLLMTEPYVG